MKIFQPLLLFLFFYGCNQSVEKNIDQNPIVQNAMSFIPDSNYVVIQHDNKRHDYFIENGKPTNLTIPELIEIEVLLDSAIKIHNLKVDSIYKVSTDGYKRQYLPYIDKSGDKLIWINFNCGAWWNEEKKDELIEVMDGGNCHFELTINLTKRSYFDFYVNGYA